LPTVTQPSLSIYCIAIGGTGMAPLACLLQELGHVVNGVDGPLYPPMSTLLENAGIHPLVGFDAEHLGPGGVAGGSDLVIVGNAVPRSNPEAQRAEELGLERISMPQAISRFLLPGRRPLVVAGTHGKTTTTSMASWIYSEAGQSPGYLIGGVPRDLPTSFRLAKGDRFVIEGDEYNASYFDRGPKFLHYQPETVLLTSVEYDHADLYPSPEALKEAYRELVSLLPDDGLLVAWGDSQEVRKVAESARCQTIFYGLEEHNDLSPVGGAAAVTMGPEGSQLTLRGPGGEARLHLRAPGAHNLLNALAVWAAARRDGIEASVVAGALNRFQGTCRRLEELGTVAGITVVDDFAHHPTAVEASLKALRQSHPGRSVTCLFEPRSLTAGRSLFQERYVEAFSWAHRVILAPVFHANRLSPEDRLDREALEKALEPKGIEVVLCDDLGEVVQSALEAARSGDILVSMSSGSFGGAPHQILEALREKEKTLI